MIIALHGHYGVGKDSVAKTLIETFGFVRYSTGDKIRDEVWNQPWPSQMPIYLRLRFLGWRWKWVEAIRARLGLRSAYSEVYEKPTTPWMRHLLQWWGYEYRIDRTDHNYWTITYFAPFIAIHKDVVITDYRAPSKMQEQIVTRLGEVWNIRREGFDGDSHRSEIRLPDETFSHVIFNDGTPLDLVAEVCRCAYMSGLR